MGFDDKGPWTVCHEDGRGIESDDFNHDVHLSIVGDFGSDAERFAYAQGLAEVLNKHNEGKE
jgi:hypothetical protein